MTDSALCLEMAIVLYLLAITVYMFALLKARVDVVTMIVMVTLGLVSNFPGVDPTFEQAELFSAFSNNTVISTIGVPGL